LCYISLSIAILTLLQDIFLLRRHQRQTFTSDMAFESAKISMFCLIAAVCIIMVFLAYLHWNQWMSNLTPAQFESVCIGAMILVMVLAVLRPPEIVTKMRGGSIKEAFRAQYFSDSEMLLAIDGIITAAHLGFPVRWCGMFPLEVTGISLYMAVVFVIGSNEPMESSVWCLCGLTGLTVASALGKRAAEMGDRQHYMDIIHERSMRCAAEFQLSQTAREERTKTPGNSNQESLPGTTPGSQVLEQMFTQSANVTEKLARVVELGNAEHWRINEAEVKLLPDKALGSGSFGQVVMGIFCGVMVAVKIPRNQPKTSDIPRLPELCNELRVLRHVRHPNIVAVQGAVISPQQCSIALVMELIKGMVLDAFVMLGPKGEQPDIPERYSLMLGVCNALLYLHTRCPHIVHGDIKGSNIMAEPIVGAVRAKLLDFGLSRVLTRNARPLGGTLAFAAPEVVKRDRPVKCSADIYSFGRLVTFIATSTPPLCNMTKAQIKKALRRGAPPAPLWPQRCAFKRGCRGLVRACLSAEERERPDVLELHGKLLALPGELDLTQGERQGLEDAHALAAQLKEPALGAEAGEPETAAAPARAEMEAEDARALAGQRKEPAVRREPEQASEAAEEGLDAPRQQQLSL